MKSMHLPKIYNTYFLAIIATLGGALFGFDISSMSAIVGIQQYLDYFNNPAGVLQGGINASLAGGSVVGAIFAGLVSDKLGRKWAIFIACIFWLVGTLLQVTTTTVGQLIVGRLLNGICVGLTSSQVPVYLAEIAKKEKRGSIICIQQLAIEFGILIMYFASYGCGFIPGPNAFRAAWAVQWIPMVFLVIGLPFLPESPRWLIKVGRFEEGLEVIANVQAGGNKDDPVVIAEVEEIKTVLNAERAAKEAGWKKYVSNGMWKRTFAGVSVQAWQQLSGANIITYYVVYIFLMANLTGNTGLIASGAQYAVFIIGTGITFVFIDFTGRRPLLIYGAIGMAICHFVVGGVLGRYGHRVPPGTVGNNANVVWSLEGQTQAGYAVIAFSYILVLVYALTLAPVAWIYAAEVWSLETRASGMGFATIGNWLFNFALGFFIPPAFRNIQWKIFIIFGVLCLGAAAQAFFSYPETCRKSLEEIEDMFRPGGPKPWQTKKGHSILDGRIDEVAVAQRKGSQVYMDTEKGGAVFNDDVKRY